MRKNRRSPRSQTIAGGSLPLFMDDPFKGDHKECPEDVHELLINFVLINLFLREVTLTDFFVRPSVCPF